MGGSESLIEAVRERAAEEVEWAKKWADRPGHFELVRVDSFGQFCADVLTLLVEADRG